MTRTTPTPTTPGTEDKVQPYMMPDILADLVEGRGAIKTLKTMHRENDLLRIGKRVDSARIAGLAADNGYLKLRVETLIDSSGRGWQMADYWKRRYGNANRERMGWRLGAGWLMYQKVK